MLILTSQLGTLQGSNSINIGENIEITLKKCQRRATGDVLCTYLVTLDQCFSVNVIYVSNRCP